MRRFEWNPEKARENVRKHGIRFEDATLVFDDPYALSEPDRIIDGEQRWRTLGMVAEVLLVLVVAHTVREDAGGEVIRIISARKANQKERREYAQARS